MSSVETFRVTEGGIVAVVEFVLHFVLLIFYFYFLVLHSFF